MLHLISFNAMREVFVYVFAIFITFMELDFEVSFDLESRKSRTLIGSIEPKIKILI